MLNNLSVSIDSLIADESKDEERVMEEIFGLTKREYWSKLLLVCGDFDAKRKQIQHLKANPYLQNLF